MRISRGLLTVAVIALCVGGGERASAASRAALEAFRYDFSDCIAARVLYRVSIGSGAEEAADEALADCRESLEALRQFVKEQGLGQRYDSAYFDKLVRGTRQAAADYAREHDVRNRDFQ